MSPDNLGKNVCFRYYLRDIFSGFLKSGETRSPPEAHKYSWLSLFKKKQFFSSLDHTTSCNWLLSKKEVISYIKIWLAAFFVLNGMAYSQQRHFFPRKWTFTRSWYWINYSQQRPIGHHDKHLKVILVSYTFVDVRYFWVFFLFNQQSSCRFWTFSQ